MSHDETGSNPKAIPCSGFSWTTLNGLRFALFEFKEQSGDCYIPEYRRITTY